MTVPLIMVEGGSTFIGLGCRTSMPTSSTESPAAAPTSSTESPTSSTESPSAAPTGDVDVSGSGTAAPSDDGIMTRSGTDDDDNGLSTGAIVGAALGGLLIIL